MRALLLLGLVFAEEAAADDDTSTISEAYDIMKELEITLVSEILDGSSFTIRDKGSEARTVRIGYVAGHKQHVTSLKGVLKDSMLLYKAWPDEQQTVPGEILADVWTTEGMHIGLAMERQHGPAKSGVEQTTDYTKDILQVAAEQEKQKSYKKLEEALKEQGEFEHAQRIEAKYETEKTSIDVKMVFGGVLIAACFIFPVYRAVSSAASENKAADARAAKQRETMKKAAAAAETRHKADAANAELRERQRQTAKEERERLAEEAERRKGR
jgi:hypothetical protein